MTFNFVSIGSEFRTIPELGNPFAMLTKMTTFLPDSRFNLPSCNKSSVLQNGTLLFFIAETCFRLIPRIPWIIHDPEVNAAPFSKFCLDCRYDMRINLYFIIMRFLLSMQFYPAISFIFRL